MAISNWQVIVKASEEEQKIVRFKESSDGALVFYLWDENKHHRLFADFPSPRELDKDSYKKGIIGYGFQTRDKFLDSIERRFYSQKWFTEEMKSAVRRIHKVDFEKMLEERKKERLRRLKIKKYLFLLLLAIVGYVLGFLTK